MSQSPDAKIRLIICLANNERNHQTNMYFECGWGN